MHGHQRGQALQEVLLRHWRALLLARKHHVQHRQRAAADRNGGAQQTPTAIRLEIGPVNHDHRAWPLQQPAGHVGIDALVLAMQMPVAEQSVKGLERCLDAPCTRPGTRHIGQGQSLTGNQCLNRPQQHAFTQRVHGTQ